jgi:uncharacterized OB-fold protein
MSDRDGGDGGDGGDAPGIGRDADEPGLTAGRCPNGHLTYPTHPRCPGCGEPQDDTLDLSDRTATVVTWTTSTATPPGVREPNHLAIVEFDVDGEPVRALGQLTTADRVGIGDEVRPVYADDLRDPDAGIRWPDSQAWDGYRFEPVE